MVERAGGAVVDTPEEADVAVFNSCAVTSDAVADLRQQVRRVARRAPAVRSVVMGCAAALDDGAIAALPGVSDVVGGSEFVSIARALDITPSGGMWSARQSGARALLRIQDGCDEHCTFCATTLARGANRSRPALDLVAEAEQLAEHHPEIVLTGVHIGAWGRDLGSSLGALVERLVLEVPTVRFRLGSIEATEVDDRLSELLTGRTALVPHLHAPLQSGSNAVLRRMGRHWYTSASYARAVERIAASCPVFALGADVITGFPGETAEDHEQTLSLVRALPFTYLHVFPYSARPHTAAPRLPRHVDAGVSRARATELRELSVAYQASCRGRRAGGTADVVVVNGAAREGLTEDYLTVIVDGAVKGRGTRFDATLTLDERGALLATPGTP